MPDRRDQLNHHTVLPILRGKQIDGAIFLPLCTPADDLTLEQLQDWGRPFVVLDRPVPNPHIPQVFIDNYQAGRRAAREFLRRGHREFLFIWGLQDFSSAKERFSGFRDELRAENIDLPFSRQIEGDFVSSVCYRNTCEAWSRLPRFSAVFGSNDSSAHGFLKAAREQGLDCPRDFSIIGFDEDPELSLLLDPPLASFAQPAVDLGRTGARLLLELMAGEASTESRIVLEASFDDRRSLALKH
jgi:DNA-binding LacI/PurR family transcriptional regulator